MKLESQVEKQSAVISGRVVNADNGQPLALVQVYIGGLQRGDVTDADGHFRIARVKAGTYSVTFQSQGFRRLLKKRGHPAGERETVELNGLAFVVEADDTLAVFRKENLSKSRNA